MEFRFIIAIATMLIGIYFTLYAVFSFKKGVIIVSGETFTGKKAKRVAILFILMGILFVLFTLFMILFTD